VVNEVVQFFESHFTDPVTLNVSIGYGEINGSSLLPTAVGESLTYITSVPYTSILSALQADQSTTADSSAVASLPAADPTGGNYWVTTSEGKALGLVAASTDVDGYIGFGSSAGLFDYNNADGIGAGQYDFFGVVAHEISEVMGRLLLTGATIGSFLNSYVPLDLFHYSSPGIRDFSGSTPGYFSIDGGATSLETFNTLSSGDAGDWAGATIDAFNAFATPGVALPVSPVDLTALDVIGWNAAPAPDLTVSNLVVTPAGDLDFVINNRGTAGSSATTARVYLSSSPSSPIASISVPALAAGTSAALAATHLLSSLPAPASAGTYLLSVVADPDNSVAEAIENNNTASVPVILAAATTGSLGSSLTGTSGNDVMVGASGGDRLNGRPGADLMAGGGGNDIYFVDNAGDQVIENAGAGTDTVYASVSWSMAGGQEIENLRTYGGGATSGETLTGNEFNNIVTGGNGNDLINGGAGNDHVHGGAGNDALNGGAGNDVLDGGAGADVMAGGTGNDLYYVDNPGDQVVENPGEGIDTVYTSVNWKMGGGQEIETLRVRGAQGLRLTGNELANTLVGGTGNDTLDGGLGNDRLSGGSGHDRFLFDAALGSNNVDTILDFSTAGDSISLDHTIFTGLTTGLLSASAFALDSANGTNSQIVYNQRTGALFYDSNGSAPGGSTKFATVSGRPALNSTYFDVV
jgi:Ca2+-binding RTX toxin-like protein